MRNIVPLILFSFAGYCWWEATNGDDRTVALSFLGSLVPSLEGDPVGQGKASAGLLAAVGVGLLLNDLRRRMSRSDDAGADAA